MDVNFWVNPLFGNESYEEPDNWSTGAVPTDGLAVIQHGEVEALNIGIDNTVVWMDYVVPGTNSLNLFGSSIGANGELLLNSDAGIGNVDLYNSGLYGTVFAGSGQSTMTVASQASAVNYGWMGLANSTAPVGLTVNAMGAFGNSGLIEAGLNGTFTLDIDASTGSYQYIGNSGILQVDPDGAMVLSAPAVPYGSANDFWHGAVINTGQINNDGGITVIQADVLQSPNGLMSVTGGGTIAVGGSVEGGTVQIGENSLGYGRLTFLPTPSVSAPGPVDASQFGAVLEFTGADGAVSFGNTTISEVFDAEHNQLSILGPWEGAPAAHFATIQLGTNRTYSAAEFSTSGNTLMFHQTTSS